MTDQPARPWGAAPTWAAPPPPAGAPSWTGHRPPGGPRRPDPGPSPRARTAGIPTWVLVLVLVVLPPVGLVLVWTSSRWRTGVRVAVTACATLLVAGVLFGVAAPSSGDSVVVTAPATPAPATPAPSPSASPAPSASPSAAPTGASAALLALAGLVVREDGAVPDYDRDAFGAAWTDTDRNGCDTRNDVLARDLQDVVFKPGTNDCAVQSGRLLDPWSGQTVEFERGRSTIEIDHVVALADAWRSGASAWPYARLLAFANDPLELLAVPAAANQSKSDANAAEWLPQQGACALTARQVAVKAKYGLTVTAAERAALTAVLTGCPDEPLPTGGTPTLAPNRSPAPRAEPVPTLVPEVRASAVPAPPVVAPPPGEAPAAGGPDLGTCAAVKAAGLGPYVAGRDPEYAYYRDPDRDGVTCE